MNELSPYRISGLERRKLKSHLSSIKSLVKNWSYMHQMEKDMASFYGGNVMSDKESDLRLENFRKEIIITEELLKQLR